MTKHDPARESPDWYRLNAPPRLIGVEGYNNLDRETQAAVYYSARRGLRHSPKFNRENGLREGDIAAKMERIINQTTGVDNAQLFFRTFERDYKQKLGPLLKEERDKAAQIDSITPHTELKVEDSELERLLFAEKGIEEPKRNR